MALVHDKHQVRKRERRVHSGSARIGIELLETLQKLPLLAIACYVVISQRLLSRIHYVVKECAGVGASEDACRQTVDIRDQTQYISVGGLNTTTNGHPCRLQSPCFGKLWRQFWVTVA